MNAQQSVCAIIPAYNAQSTIARAINSALAEPEIIQVIVVDDVSSDNTVEAAKSCDNGSGRLLVLKQDNNQGPSAARNKALEHAKTEWVSILDADDFFISGRIAGLLAHQQDTDMIADDLWQVPEEDVEGPRRAMIGDEMTLPQNINLQDFVLSNVTRAGHQRCELGFIKPLIRKSFLDSHEIKYREDMRLGEDYDLYTRALAAGARLILVPAQGYVSVVRSNSLSGCHSEEDLRGLRDCNLGIARGYELSPSDQKALRAHYLNTDCRLQWRLLILAVKNKNIIAAIKTFIRPWPVPAYLTGKLWEQVKIRCFGRSS